MRPLLLCLGLAAGVARAQVPPPPEGQLGEPPPPPAAAESSAAPARAPALTRYGVLFDGGFPDGFALAFAYRPHWAVRLSLGGTYNIIGAGIRAGVSAVPFRAAVTPSLSLDAGHAFSADMGTFVRLFANKIPDALQTPMKSVSYDYVDLLVGLEVGSQQRFSFYLKAGVSRVWATAGNFTYQTTSGVGTTAVTTTWTGTAPAVNPGLPSVKLGFIYWIQ